LRRLIGIVLALLFTGMAAARVEDAPVVNARLLLADAPAPLLSDYNLFRDAAARMPSAGVTPYDLNTTLYSDGALKFRYVFVPSGAAARYEPDEVFEFPVGATLIKTFAVAADMRRPQENVRFLETRLLIRRADGWTARAYIWNEAQTEARYTAVGADVAAHWIDEEGQDVALDWRVPNRNQCKGCHERRGEITPLGPTARNLNRDHPYRNGTRNQLAQWSALGILVGAPAPNEAARAPVAFDPTSASIDARARAYLDVNCANCHNPQGPAHTSGLDLRAGATDPRAWGVRKRPVAAGRASAGMDFAIEPGRPERSILVYRMESTDPGVMMPELGRQRVDAHGVELIREWIAAMDRDGNAAPP
jgi:uncharacterized repeat protein (TIGR03806 family)